MARPASAWTQQVLPSPASTSQSWPLSWRRGRSDTRWRRCCRSPRPPPLRSPRCSPSTSIGAASAACVSARTTASVRIKSLSDSQEIQSRWRACVRWNPFHCKIGIALAVPFPEVALCPVVCLPRGAVLASGPFRGTAPRGRPRSCLVVSPALVALAAWSRERVGFVVRARDRHTHVPRPAAACRGRATREQAGGARPRGPLGRAVGPGRGRFRPRGARGYSGIRLAR